MHEKINRNNNLEINLEVKGYSSFVRLSGAKIRQPHRK
jgi:hypothetical protein